MRNAVSFANVEKAFSQSRGALSRSFLALSNLNLQIREGEFFCLLGPSGCGKSTVLNMIAGFEVPTAGELLVKGLPVGGPDVTRGMVFQTDAALFEWLTVSENVGFGLRMKGVAEAARDKIVAENVRRVGLAGQEHKFPHELSGGMKQRVQLARVMANNPEFLLMDEPFAALDAQTKRHMQHETERIWSGTGKTTVFVTHDIGEAITLGDRVGVMTAGPEARMKMVYEVNIPRPRAKLTDRFVELFNTIEADIEEEVRRSIGPLEAAR